MPLSEHGGATLRVEPDQILRLKTRLDAIRDEVGSFLRDNRQVLNVRPLGKDPVSDETAQAFNENADAALAAAWGYHHELTRVVDALDEAAKEYKRREEANAQKYQERDR
jgi:hypothetical protein